MVGGGGATFGTVVENGIFRQRLGQLQHIGEAGSDALGSMRQFRYRQVARENGERIHQNMVVPAKWDTFLYRWQVCQAQKAFSFLNGLGIHLGTGGNDACRVELYLIGYAVYIQLFHPHTGEGSIIVACRLPGCQLSG